MEIDKKALFKELEDQKYALDQAAIVVATDRQGRITYANDKFCEISEYSKEELLGQTHRLVNSGIHSREFFGSMWKVIQSGQVWRGEISNKAKSGRIYWVQTTIVPFLDPDGRPYQYLSIRQDITALKEAERMIFEQQSKLVAASKLSALGELSAALTHEINNPLGVILGRVEMLHEILKQSSPPLETVRQMVDSIEATARRIEKIMKTVRALSHGGEGEPLQRLPLASVIESALDIVGARLRNHGVRLELALSDPQKVIEVRPTQIFQILINLINNAHDAVLSQPGAWIRISSREEGEGLNLSVTDSGTGLTEEVRSRLFQPFLTTKQVGVGTRLGLTISQSLAHRNGIRLWVDMKSTNTCFHLWIPLRGPAVPIQN